MPTYEPLQTVPSRSAPATVEERIRLAVARTGPEGLTMAQVRAKLTHIPAVKVRQALDNLVAEGAVRCYVRRGRGRPALVTIDARHPEPS